MIESVIALYTSLVFLRSGGVPMLACFYLWRSRQVSQRGSMHLGSRHTVSILLSLCSGHLYSGPQRFPMLNDTFNLYHIWLSSMINIKNPISLNHTQLLCHFVPLAFDTFLLFLSWRENGAAPLSSARSSALFVW